MNDRTEPGGVGENSPGSVVTVKAATLFTGSTVFLMSAYGFLLLVPVLISIVAVSIHPFGTSTWLIPLLVLLASLFLLPIGFGNPHVGRIVRKLDGRAVAGDWNYIVQITLYPRVATGLQSALEDADDIGVLSFEDSNLVFKGDRVFLRLRYDDLNAVDLLNIGWRGLFLYGPVTCIRLAGVDGFTVVRFGERSSWTLPQSRRIAHRMYRCLAERVQKAQ